jgi:maltose O-acetyltransferase
LIGDTCSEPCPPKRKRCCGASATIRTTRHSSRSERARELTEEFNRTAAGDDERGRALVEELFGTVGEDVYVEPPFRCDYGSNVHVGDEFFANYDSVVLDVCRVEFGDDCMLGPGVHVYATTHPVDLEERRSGLESGRPVTVGDESDDGR